jgi:hypothetical protein
MNPSTRQLARYGWRPAEPPRRPVLLVNPRSGGGKAASAGVAERARAKGIEVVIFTSGQDLAALAHEAVAAGADALGLPVNGGKAVASSWAWLVVWSRSAGSRSEPNIYLCYLHD